MSDRKTFLECMFADLNCISEGTDEEVREELEEMGIDVAESERRFKNFLQKIKKDKTKNTTCSQETRKMPIGFGSFGDSDRWKLLCKAYSETEDWVKSTKAMQIDGVGCIVQISTQQGSHVAEAVVFVPGIKIVEDISSMSDSGIDIVVGRHLESID